MAGSLDSNYVVFRLADEEYGLPVAQVSSIIRYESATPVPRAPKSVMGVVNLRGRVIPVVDLSLRFKGVKFEPGPQSRIVVAEGAAGSVGIAVDMAHEVAEFDPETIKPVPDGVLSPETARAFTGLVGRDDDHLVILLDLDEAVPRSDYTPLASSEEEGQPGV